MKNQNPDKTARQAACLNCANSFSLPAGEPFDDGTVSDCDRLVCMPSHKIVLETHLCENHA